MKCEHVAKLLEQEQGFPLTNIGLKLLGFKPFERKDLSKWNFLYPSCHWDIENYPIKICEGLVHTEDGSAQGTSAPEARRVQPIVVHFFPEHLVVNQCQAETALTAWDVQLVLLQEESACQALQQICVQGEEKGFFLLCNK